MSIFTTVTHQGATLKPATQKLSSANYVQYSTICIFVVDITVRTTEIDNLETVDVCDW